MKRYTSFFLFLAGLLLLSSEMAGQAAWIEPGGDAFNPDAEATIYVDLEKTSNDFGIIEASQSGQAMFIWTWQPKEHPAGHPLANGIGSQAWKNSNDALMMTKEDALGPYVYSYTMVPTQFYEVDAATVYNNDFEFLIKPKDGGGFGDPDIKTEDLKVEVAPPGLAKVFTIPVGTLSGDTAVLASTPDEVFTIRYDQAQEEAPSLIDATEFYVYLRGEGSDGNQYQVAPNLNAVDETPELRMTAQGQQVYTLSFIPNRFYKDVPPGVDIVFMRYQIVKKGFSSTADVVADGTKNEFRYTFSCE